MSAVWAKVKPQVKSKPFAGHIGAELSGVTGSGQLSKAVSDQIYQALLQYKMLFFRKKQNLTDVEQEKIAALFEQPITHPTAPVLAGTRLLLELGSRLGGRANCS